MALRTFNFDSKTEQTIEHLKKHYGASSKAEVLRKAVALLDLAAEIEDKKGKLIAKRNNEEQEIIIR
jgi:hypothetical protein